MRAFCWFVALVIIALLVGASIAYPAFTLASTIGSWAFHRVAGRIAMLLLAIELTWLARHLNIRSKPDFGYGLPWRRFIPVALVWGIIGTLSAVPAAAFLIATRIRVFNAGFVADVHSMPHLLLIGLGSGIAVALIEETVMRGGLHTAIQRESGPWAAALLTASLFAVLHFFAKVRIPPEQIGWGSGFDVLTRSFAPLLHPLAVLDSFLAWFAIGLILSLTRILTGNIAVAIGLHAGWVVVLRMLQESTQGGAAGPYSQWVGHFDGLVGYWILPWGLVVAASLWFSRRSWVPLASQ
jgi:uncharacterized protein